MNDVKSCHWEVKMKLFLLVIVVISFFLVLGGAYSLYKHQYEEGTGGYMLIITVVSASICLGAYKLHAHIANTSASAKTEQSSSDHYCLIKSLSIKSSRKMADCTTPIRLILTFAILLMTA